MSEPTAEDVRELVDAAWAFIAYTIDLFEQRRPYCEGWDEQHLPRCQVAELKRKLPPMDWSREPAEDCPDISGLVIARMQSSTNNRTGRYATEYATGFSHRSRQV